MAHIPTDTDTIQEMGRWYMFNNEHSRVIRFLLGYFNIIQYISSILFTVTTGSSGMKKETEKDNLKDDMDFSTNTVI